MSQFKITYEDLHNLAWIHRETEHLSGHIFPSCENVIIDFGEKNIENIDGDPVDIGREMWIKYLEMFVRDEGLNKDSPNNKLHKRFVRKFLKKLKKKNE